MCPSDGSLPFGKDARPEYPETHERKYLAPKLKVQLVKNQQGCCAICGEKPRVFEYDHRVELWAGGTNDFANWQALCAGCHKDKSGAEAKHRAKMNRLRGKAGQVKRRKERGSQIPSRPFSKAFSTLSMNPKSAACGLKSRGFDKRLGKRMNGQVYSKTTGENS